MRREALLIGLMLASACAAPAPPPTASVPATATPPATPAPTGTPTRSPTQTALPSATPTGASTGTPAATQAVSTGQVLSITQVLGLSFIDNLHGWLLGAACQGNLCPATMRRTQDGGKTWEGLPAPATDATSFPTYFPWRTGDAVGVNSVRFATAQDGWAFGPSFYSTHDGGQTWLNENRLVSDVAVTKGAIWAVEQKGTTPVIERSTDAGRTWAATKMQPLLIGWPTITSVDPETAWLFSQDSVLNPQLIVTNDGGNAWAELQPPARACPTAVLKAASALFLWYVCGGIGATAMQVKQVYTSSNGGISWTLQADSSLQNPAKRGITNQGHILSPKQFAAPSASTACTALNRGTLIMTEDGGRHWTDAIPYERANGGGDPAMGPVEFANARDGWLAVGPNRLFRTTDGGHTWTDSTVP